MRREVRLDEIRETIDRLAERLGQYAYEILSCSAEEKPVMRERIERTRKELADARALRRELKAGGCSSSSPM